MLIHRRAATPFILLALSPLPALAQERPFEVHAAIVRSHQPESSLQYPRVSPPLAGDSTGAAIGFGRRVATDVWIEGEVLVSGTVSVAQSSSQGSTERYLAESRDVVGTVNVRWRPEEARFFSLVAGGGFAWARLRKREVQRRDGTLGSFEPRPPKSTTDILPAFTAGVDMSLPVARTVSLLFPARVRWVHRRHDEPTFLIVMNRVAWHVGAGVSVRF